ncbi:hypothetical protein WA026_008554 [Henosepilachna vigintioctopunctata]|uniref:Ig-like domain-containing protein n=1 Tax=Henosepilachna vigintioctopunctata TaxID=420089 RepID=A0AAW1UBK9_9CUCU
MTERNQRRTFFLFDVIYWSIINLKLFAVVQQFYQSRVIDEFVLKGNTGILKCLVPSFVTDYVQIEAWIADDGTTFKYEPSMNHDSVVNQYYEPQVYDVFVIKGNTAVFKCQIPSFVSDHVEVVSWQDTQNNKYLPPTHDYVVSQSYTANVMDESVLKGNTAIFKCHIPSFVSDFVYVISWLQDDKKEIVTQDNLDSKYLVLPSGELHIKDVGPEDGYKSYQCRTRHRLTGETRLSATKGRLVITEPVGSVRPNIPKFPTVDIFVQNTSFALLCPAQAFPAPSYSHFLFPDSGKYFEMDLTLLIFLVEPVGRLSPKISAGISRIQTIEGLSDGSLVLLCPAQAFPVPSFRWYKFVDGTARKQPVTLNDRVKQVAGTLIIREAKVEDSGKYLCVVNNSVGGESVETVLTVTAPLKAKIEPQVQTIDFGRPAVFTCNFEGNPIKTISWLKDGHPIDHSEAVLRIEAVRKEDKGMYQCFIRNDQESAESIAELKLGGRFEPPQIRHTFNEETVQPGNSIFLKCIASGIPSPEMTWELYGRKLSNTDRYQIGQYVTVNGDVVSNLNITSINTNDGGLYRCVASSKVGSADHSARINVYGLPFVRSMEKQAIVAGGTLIVHCPFAGHPVEAVVWERDGRVLPINRKQKVFKNGTLIIENVERASDQATYVCVAKNAQGYSARGSLEVQVMVRPQIHPFDFGDESINSGDITMLTCMVTKGDFPMKIYWLFNNHTIDKSNGVTVMNTNKRASQLTIESVQAHHAGEYICVAENNAGLVKYAAYLNVNVVPQILPLDFGEESINSGDVASLTCTVHKGDLPIKINWLHNNRSIEPNSGILVLKAGKKVTTLTIDSVQAEHAGEFTCIAENKAGLARYSTTLHVNVPPQILPLDFGEESVNSGDLASLTCSVHKGDLPITIKWYHNNNRLSSGNGVILSAVVRKVSTLTIESVQAAHAGEYTCIAKNEAGSVQYSVDLHVNVAPQILPFDFGEETVNSGDLASATCSVHKGDLPIDIQWLHNNVSVSNNEGILITMVGKKISTLSIDSVKASHAGIFTCIARNKAGFAHYSAGFNVNVPPQILPFDFGEETVNSGDLASLQCTVHKGDLPITIKWLHNNQTIHSGNGILLTSVSKKVSSLTIDSVKDHHMGLYTCLAKNEAGYASHSSNLFINVPPQILPFDFGEDTVNSGDLASLHCTVHKGDLPINITWYHNNKTIHYSDGILITKAGKKVSSITIESVKGSHAGTYTCVAENNAGVTSYSSVLSVNVAPQISHFAFEADTANSGDLVSTMCSIHKGDIPMNITWYLNNQTVASISGIMVSMFGNKISALRIDSVQETHSGTYTCVAQNSAGLASYSANLHVKVVPQISHFAFEEDTSNSGDSISTMCSIHKGDLPVNITWFLNNRTARNIAGISISRVGKKISTLSIDSVQAEHAGTYTCLVQNIAGSASYSADLHVNVSPQLTHFDFGQETINSGDLITTSCSLHRGDLPVSITWYLNNKTVDSTHGVQIFMVGKKISTLSIESVQQHHAGTYTCVAQNAAGIASYSANLHINVEPQISHFDSGEKSMNSGDSISFTCSVHKGDLPIDIRWFFNNASAEHVEGIVIFKAGAKNSMLSIDSLKEHHTGTYTCVARNKAGAASYSADVQINVAPQISHFDAEEDNINSGDSISLTCSVHKGDLPIDIHWYLNNITVENVKGIVLFKAGKKISTLSIDSIQAYHSGTYTCIARNRAGTSTYSTDLHVNVAPQLSHFDFGEDNVNSGDSVSLNCNAHKGDLPIRLSWLLNNKSVDGMPGIATMKMGRKIMTLSIDPVQGIHAGTYMCLAENDAGMASYSAELRVNVLPQITPFDTGDDAINSGDSVSLNCNVHKGDTPVNITWYLNNNNLHHSSDVSIVRAGKKTSTLSIDSVQENHAGSYTCVAHNRAGSASFSTDLHVNGTEYGLYACT